jgi:hypothetical protein
MPWPYRSIRVSLRAMFRLSLSASSPHLLHSQYRCLGSDHATPPREAAAWKPSVRSGVELITFAA